MSLRESKNMKFHRLATRATVHRSAPAQSMVEFALVAMILFLLLFGIFEIAQLVFTINSVNNGAREAAHWAALHPSTLSSGCTASSCSAATNTAVKQAIAQTLFLVDTNNATDFNLTVSCPTCSGTGSYPPVTVSIQYTVRLAVPFPFLGSSSVISSASTALVER
jgi:Flp pilus assembly protein TadG